METILKATTSKFNHVFANVGKEAFEDSPQSITPETKETPFNSITNTPTAKIHSVHNPSTPA